MMNKINLFWKTWIITIITIMLSLGIFTGYVYISTVTFIDRRQEQQQTQDMERITQHLEEYGLDVEFLNAELQRGNIIQVMNEQQQNVFPTELSIVIAEDSSSEIPPNFPIYEGATVNEIQTSNDLLAPGYNIVQLEREILIDGEPHTISMFSAGSIQTMDILANMKNIVPGFLIVAILVSGFASFLYAKYFSTKIKKLNSTIDDMGQMKKMPVLANTGDELQQLENNLYQMYGKLQQAMEQLTEENNYSKRLEQERSIFMKGATHELKTPIMTMSSMIEGMLEQIEGYENHDDYLIACNVELQKMTQLVHEILEVARLEHLRFDGFSDLTCATEEVLQDYQYLINDSNIHITTELLANVQCPMTIKNAKKILSNLIGNSVKYTPPQGNIHIVLTNQMLEITNDIYPVEQQIKDIMNAFVTYQYSDSNESKGHGLGLYIVDYILQQYELKHEYIIDEQAQQFIFRIYL